MANILILTLVFPPDNVSTAQLMGELATDLRKAENDVFVVTTVPHYNFDPGTCASQPLAWFLRPIVKKSLYHGIPVLHVWMPGKGKNALIRMMAWLFFHVISTLIGFCISFRPDLILTPSPPLSIGVSAWLIGLARRAKYIYNIQEIYPDFAIHLGVIKSRVMIRMLTELELFVYRKAAVLTTISAGMQNQVIAKGVLPGKVRVIPNFVDIGNFEILQKKNEFSCRYGFEDKFIISYAGNMGKPQGLEVFLHAMRLLVDCPNIHLLMVGSGSEYEPLRSMAQKYNLPNVTFLPQQPYSTVPLIYACSDLSIVAQAVRTYSDGIPSKVYRIMSSGRAVLAYTNEMSDLGMLIREARAGLVVSFNEAAPLAEAIRTAFEAPDKCAQWGLNGHEYAAAHFSRECVTQQYADLIEELSLKKGRMLLECQKN